MDGQLCYFVIHYDEQHIVTCCIKQNMICDKDLRELDALLAYYNENYKTFIAPLEEGFHICKNIEEIRSHIIDANINRNNI